MVTAGRSSWKGIKASSRLILSARPAGRAHIEVQSSITFWNFGGYWNTSFTSGIPTPPAKEIIWNITIVPEPGTTLLLGLGVLALRLLRRQEGR